MLQWIWSKASLVNLVCDMVQGQVIFQLKISWRVQCTAIKKNCPYHFPYFNLEIFFIKNIFILKNLIHFHKTVETGVDLCLNMDNAFIVISQRIPHIFQLGFQTPLNQFNNIFLLQDFLLPHKHRRNKIPAFLMVILGPYNQQQMNHDPSFSV